MVRSTDGLQTSVGRFLQETGPTISGRMAPT
ncbi:hypothetical protein GGR20_000924 [Devosia subaequoris]|uniref:Uncharacterized protein n=1 Tax=Devosia subaequoris TaxID=395930 RepID=A0A7W6ILK0_9HYPH|nr:hypothetical protein [Devosia subaequoris]